MTDAEAQWVMETHASPLETATENRYPIDIRNQTLINAGNTSFDISGKVQGDGAVAVRISYGDKSANGSGRLFDTTGEGHWSGGADPQTLSTQIAAIAGVPGLNRMESSYCLPCSALVIARISISTPELGMILRN